jgi:hypothetical protein
VSPHGTVRLHVPISFLALDVFEKIGATREVARTRIALAEALPSRDDPRMATAPRG